MQMIFCNKLPTYSKCNLCFFFRYSAAGYWSQVYDRIFASLSLSPFVLQLWNMLREARFLTNKFFNAGEQKFVYLPSFWKKASLCAETKADQIWISSNLCRWEMALKLFSLKFPLVIYFCEYWNSWCLCSHFLQAFESLFIQQKAKLFLRFFWW